MQSGVSFEDPDCAYIDQDVEIGQDSFIGVGVRLCGHTKLGKQVIVEAGSSITNSVVGDLTKIKLNSVIEDAEIGGNCSVGPFARLRPGTKLSKQVHIGNFVETKKAELKDGVKGGAPFLSGGCYD